MSVHNKSLECTLLDLKKPFRNTQVANEINITIYNTTIFAREIKYRLFKCPSTEESLNQNNPRLWNDMQYLSNIKFCIFQNRKRMFMIYFKWEDNVQHSVSCLLITCVHVYASNTLQNIWKLCWTINGVCFWTLGWRNPYLCTSGIFIFYKHTYFEIK